jgi:hypothetical protein
MMPQCMARGVAQNDRVAKSFTSDRTASKYCGAVLLVGACAARIDSSKYGRIWPNGADEGINFL